MGNEMILNRYIAALSFFCLLASGCTPSLNAPSLPKTRTGQEQQTRPDLGSFQDVLTEQKTVQPTGNTNPVSEEQTPESISKKVRFLLPSTAFINARIAAYNKKLDDWRQLQNQSSILDFNQEDTEKIVNCFQDIQRVLNGYTNMHDMIEQLNSSSPPIINAVDILELQRTDIEFLEGACNRLMVFSESKNAMQSTKPTDISQIETLLKRHWDAKEYEDVVQTWSKIPDSQIGNIDKKTKVLYGHALMFLHQEERAAEVYQQIVNQTVASDEQRNDLLSLRKILADLYTASGNYPAAQQQYLEILKEYQGLGSIDKWSKTHLSILKNHDEKSPELVKYSGILRNYMGFIPEQDGYKFVWQADTYLKNYPNSPVAADVTMMRADALKRADAWFNNVFVEVDRLSKDKQFAEAIKKLQAIPDDIVSPEQRLKIRDKNDALALSDAVQRETEKMSKMQELQHRWNNGLSLLDEGKFDEAVAVFKGFQDTEFATKAEEKLKEISVIAAKAERRKAAQLFVRFTKTSNPEYKKRLLIEARKLLTDILVKYPDIDFADKVRDNIKTVEKEMNSLDPNLLPSILEIEAKKGIDNGGMNTEKYPDVTSDIKNVQSNPEGINGKVQENDLKQP